MRILFFISFFTFNFIFSQYKVPKNFVEVDSSPANGRKIEKIKFDFDGDKKDEIISLITEKENEFNNYFILIYLSKSNKNILFKLIPCYDDFAIYPFQINKTEKNIISFGYGCDGTSAFCRKFKIRFDDKKQNFVLIGYDSSYRITAGHSDKSINLLTKNFTVTNRDYFFSAENPKIDTYEGKCFVKPIEINMVGGKTLKNLDSCGEKFEPH